MNTIFFTILALLPGDFVRPRIIGPVLGMLFDAMGIATYFIFFK